MLDDLPGALETARSYLAQLDDTDSPLTVGRGRTDRLPGPLPRPVDALVPGPTSCGTGQRVSCDRARAGLTDEWRPTYYGVQLALAEAYAARYAGEPAVAQFRAATTLAEPFGAYFALEPRLNLATSCSPTAAGTRAASSSSSAGAPPTTWVPTTSSAAPSGSPPAPASPCPESAAREGPLSRLTPREREVLDLLATGATNKTIATTLFITEKTASVHVSNLLAKLGVANRGEAAALARQLVG